MVPNFGGFVSNTVPSKINAEQQRFTPPSKIVSFNVNLQQNDGLLVNHLATSLKISYDEALKIIQKEVVRWKSDLKNAPLLLQNIGQLTLINGQLSFEPIDKINYLTSSFGLSDVDANYILRQNKISSPAISTKKTYGKYIAAAAVVSGLLLGGSLAVNYAQHQQEVAHQQALTAKIQKASFDILKPLPSVTVTVEKEVAEVKEIEYKYHIVAGAFKEAKNAKKKVAILQQKGYEARILRVNKWGLTEVCYASFQDKRTAINTLNKIKREDNKYAWLLVNE